MVQQPQERAWSIDVAVDMVRVSLEESSDHDSALTSQVVSQKLSDHTDKR